VASLSSLGMCFVFFTQIIVEHLGYLPWVVYRSSSVISHISYGAFGETPCGFDNVVYGGVIATGFVRCQHCHSGHTSAGRYVDGRSVPSVCSELLICLGGDHCDLRDRE
jgi:hypothetical protein